MVKKKVSKIKKLFSGISAAQIPNPAPILQSTYQSVLDNLIKKGRLIISNGNASAATTIIYTVPVGKTFYLCGVTLSTIGTSSLAGNGYSYIVIDANVAAKRLLTNQIYESHTVAGASYAWAENSSGAVSQNYGIPIRLEAGQTIAVYSDTGANIADGCIYGYEIDKPLE